MFYNAVLYIAVVLIWGSTWLSIRYQVGEDVITLHALFYRFALAALLTQATLFFSGRFRLYSLKQHGWFLLLGLFLFCLNYYLFYVITEQGMTTGLVAVVFSLLLTMNMVNSRLFFKQSTDTSMIIGSILGLFGIGLVFHQDINGLLNGHGSVAGLLTGILATYLASLGNMVSKQLQQQKIDVINANGWGMTYGASALFIGALFMGEPFTFSAAPSFVLNWIYLAVFGSVIAFWAYLTLLGRIGSDRAAYSTLVFPVVALWLSWLFEDFIWTGETLAGIALILIGNIAILKRPELGLKKLKPLKKPA